MAARDHRQTAVLTVLVAVAMRVPFVLTAIHQPGFTWRWGGEMFSIANAIVNGKGFSSPYWAQTGPTAEQVPGFPYFIAMLYHAGHGSMQFAAYAVLSLNVLFSALACLPVAQIGDYLMPGRGFVFGLSWALLPILGYSEVGFLWDTSAYVLIFAVLLWRLLLLPDERRDSAWWWWGMLGGASLLVDPAHLLMLLASLTALVLTKRVPLRRYGLAVGAMLLVVAPWEIRNNLVFGHRMFLRSNVGFEVYRGLITSPSEPDDANSMNPGRNSAELARFQQLGEYRYMADQNRLASQFIVDHPRAVVHRIASRFVAFWAGTGEVWRNRWRIGMFLKHVLFTLPAALGLCGLLLMWRLRQGDSTAMIFAIMMLVFPLPYYVTLTQPRYRAPMEPALVILGVFGSLVLVERRRNQMVLLGRAASR